MPTKVKVEAESREWVDAAGWISDDSSFYGNHGEPTNVGKALTRALGDEGQKAELEAQTLSFSPLDYFDESPSWQLLRPSHTSDPVANRPKPFNPFKDQAYSARQLEESVPEFVRRLPPATTPADVVDNWIWIANPYSPRRETDSDIKGFSEAGNDILASLDVSLETIQQTMSSKIQAVRTRAENKARKEAQEALLAAATKHGVSTGKWMLFPAPTEVDRHWQVIAEATAEGKLGDLAKVAADEGKGERAARLICVYTRDFRDEDDVKRVLQELLARNIVKRPVSAADASRAIYYKPGKFSRKCLAMTGILTVTDAYTDLGIVNGNQYGIRASLYSSRDFLK